MKKQVQNVAKLLQVREATDGELEQLFPDVKAGVGLDAQRYAPVQGFARLDGEDELPLFDYLCKTNASVVPDIAGNAERP